MIYSTYQDYLDAEPGELRVVIGVACDLCKPIDRGLWDLGRPWLCEEHAREYGLIW